MKTKVINLKVSKQITEVCEKLQDAGFETYIVGGAVRDFLINKVPKDYDISTSATPKEIRRTFGRKHARIIGRRFKLVHLHCGSEIIEISTFRRMPSKAAQNVKVRKKLNDVPQNMIFNDNEFGSSEEDAQRRDFTINALFYDPVACKLIDYTGLGMDDIENRLVRAIGDPKVRFEEDPVRILRALKFAGQCGMELEKETREALIKNLPLIRLAAASRLTLELEKILKNTHSHKILTLFKEYGFLDYFLPELSENWDPIGKTVMQLLEIRNKRIASGLYRDSMSLAIALITLPFIERKLGELSKDNNWLANISMDELGGKVFCLIKETFAPHALIKALIYSSQRILKTIPELLQEESFKKAVNKSGYPHAREAMIILNEVRWENEHFEETLPVKVFTGRLNRHKRHNHRISPKKRSKSKKT